MSPKPSSREKEGIAELLHSKHLAQRLVQSEGADCCLLSLLSNPVVQGGRAGPIWPFSFTSVAL